MATVSRVPVPAAGLIDLTIPYKIFDLSQDGAISKINYCMENGFMVGPLTSIPRESYSSAKLYQVIYKPYVNPNAIPPEQPVAALVDNRILPPPAAAQAARPGTAIGVRTAVPLPPVNWSRFGGTRKNKRTKRHSKKSRANRH